MVEGRSGASSGAGNPAGRTERSRVRDEVSKVSIALVSQMLAVVCSARGGWRHRGRSEPDPGGGDGVEDAFRGEALRLTYWPGAPKTPWDPWQ